MRRKTKIIKSREWTSRQRFACIASMIFLTTLACLLWPQTRPQASTRATTFEAWAAREDANAAPPPCPVTAEQYSDILTALGEAPAVPTSPEEAEMIQCEKELEANYLALDAGNVATKETTSKARSVK